MKATLIFPGVTNCGWNSFGRVNNSDAQFIPHGLAHIASYAKSEGHIIDVIDLRRLNGWDDFDKEIRKRSPGVFAVSSMSVDFGNAIEAVRKIKHIDSSSTVILGGVHATVAFDDVKGLDVIDFIIKGEGEISFSNLLRDIEKGQAKERIIIGIQPDINKLPYPDRDLFGFEEGEMRAPWLPHMPAPFVSIIASRGCPHKCTFCQPAERAVFGGRARIRTVESVIEELKYLRERYSFKSLLIHDDYFAFNPKWVEKFCDEYEKNGFDQIFTCQVRSDFIVRNRELVSRMVRAGLSCFMIGFESGSQRILDFIKKETTVEMNRQAVRICRENGIKIFANYMMGLPEEKPSEVYETIEFIRWARPDYPSAAFFTPHPGSELYEYCEKHGLSLIKDYKSFARNPVEPKIKGVDYSFLDFAVKRSTEYKVDEKISVLSKNPLRSTEESELLNQLIDFRKKLNILNDSYRKKFGLNSSELCELSKGKTPQRKKETVLVTGGTGFIGSALARRLLQRGYPVAVLTRDVNKHNAKVLASEGVQVVQGCVEDSSFMNRLEGMDIVCHFAVFQGTEGSQMFEVNVSGTENALEMALKNKVKKFIYASSIEAQGTTGNNMKPLQEEDICRPVSDYGRSKEEGEQAVGRYVKDHGLQAITARIGNVYGIGGLSFIHAMSTAIIEKNVLLSSLPVFYKRIVQPIYIDDLINAFVKTIEDKNSICGTFNYTGHQPATIEEWFREIAVFLGLEKNIDDILDHSIDMKEIPGLKKAHAHINYFMSGDAPNIHRLYTDMKLLSKVGDYQTYSLQKGLAYTLDWYHRAGVFNKYIGVN